MTTFKSTAFLLLASLIAVGGVELAGRVPLPGAVVLMSTAEAKVGRPLTPVSVAGSARRTTRRCAAGVYNC
ncbi:MAG: hypothetical protein AB1749_14250 [Pseudomonadota bacterium]